VRPAAENGHQEVLQWAREHGCPWDSNVLRAWSEGCPKLSELWAANEPMTAWEGVTIGEAGGADAGRVVAVELMGLDLTGDLPAALGGLTALTRLDLSCNQLTSVPAALGGLTALMTLDFGGNQLTRVPAALGGLTALRFVNLACNQLHERAGVVEGRGVGAERLEHYVYPLSILIKKKEKDYVVALGSEESGCQMFQRARGTTARGMRGAAARVWAPVLRWTRARDGWVCARAAMPTDID